MSAYTWLDMGKGSQRNTLPLSTGPLSMGTFGGVDFGACYQVWHVDSSQMAYHRLALSHVSGTTEASLLASLEKVELVMVELKLSIAKLGEAPNPVHPRTSTPAAIYSSNKSRGAIHVPRELLVSAVEPS